jgi:hypothetical protein
MTGGTSVSEPKNSQSARSILILIVFACLCFVSGCYARASEGNVATYRYARWVPPAVIAVGLLAIPLGLLLGKGSKTSMFVAIGITSIVLLTEAPLTYSNYVIIDDDHFETDIGLWFASTESKHRSVQFQDLKEIRYVETTYHYGRRPTTNYDLHCIPKKGEPFVVQVSGGLVNNSLPEILYRAKAKGVKVVNQAVQRGYLDN